jgi:ribonucleoside-diphosphate reductase alpha chain
MSTVVDETKLDALPKHLLAHFPEEATSTAVAVKKYASAAIEAYTSQDSKALSQAIAVLRGMLDGAGDHSQEEGFHELSEFIYQLLLYFCNVAPVEVYPSQHLIPTEFLLLTVDQHCFDIRTLAHDISMEGKQLLNPLTQKPFHSKDQQRIFSLMQEKSLMTSNAADEVNDLAGFQHESYVVIKRNGNAVDFSRPRIEAAVRKAMLANDVSADILDEKVTHVTYQALQIVQELCPNGGVIHIENIQNCVEKSLMMTGEHNVAHSYILYREKRNQERKQQIKEYVPSVRITALDGSTKELDKEGLSQFLRTLGEGIKSIDYQRVLDEAYKNLYDGISYHDLNTALIMVTRPLVEEEPAYSFFAARLLKHRLCEEALSFFQGSPIQLKDPSFDYSKLLSQYVHKGVEHEYLDKQLLTFDLAKLSSAIDVSRDSLFSFFSLQTLYDRYFIHHQETRIELPQLFFMRVAMGLALNEKGNKEQRAVEYYNLISKLTYMCATPTLFNSGTRRSQLSSCFLLSVDDDLPSIFEHYYKMALISKFAGGIGTSWSKVRANSSWIKGTNGKSSGVVPFLNIADATATAVNQGGKRKGAVCAYLETWHLDIFDFLDLRKNAGDERRRTHDMNTANWIPDLFMKRVIEKGSWTLFSPDDVPNLHNHYGADFEQHYIEYEAQAKEGKMISKTIEATHLWRKMLTMLYETGHPWITFKCPSNIRNPQQHVGDIHSSNLCTEITLNTSKDEIAVCNLGSINLDRHITKSGQVDYKKLKRTIKTAVRMLDNVIDLNYYSVDETKNSNLKHRPVGLGMMGLQDALYRLNIPYDSDAAVEFSDELMEYISYYAIDASIELAKERGTYPSYNGSLWDQGILPIDSIQLLKKQRERLFPNGDDICFEMDATSRLDWDALREKLSHYGMRNSNVMAIAPTATIANISNVSQSTEPMYMNLAVKSTLSGEFTVVNSHLVKVLKAEGLWDDVMVKELKYFNGSIQEIDRIPQHIRDMFKTAFEIDPLWLIKGASRRQKWIDQSQSLNLYVAGVSGKKLDVIYKTAWKLGLKTTYYLRTVGASDGEKSTIHDGKLNKVAREEKPATAAEFCSIEDPDCEACQ